jgi:GNAT superfamily N-acetyltransferase
VVPTIRVATVGDAVAIERVRIASWRWAYRDIVPEALLETLDENERTGAWAEHLGANEPGSETLVVEEDGRVVGFCGFGPSRDEDTAPATGQVMTIYLVKEAAGRGIGRALFTRANERLRELGYEAATLWTLEANEPTRRFYEAAGWFWDGNRSTFHVQHEELPIVRYRVDLSPP